VVAQAFNTSIWEAEAGRFLRCLKKPNKKKKRKKKGWRDSIGLSSRDQLGLQSEFQDSQDYTEKPCGGVGGENPVLPGTGLALLGTIPDTLFNIKVFSELGPHAY
jgi:hypothetical protein